MKKIILLILFPTLVFAQTSHTINAGNFYYSPSVLNINIGDTVFWINDGGFHNVNFDINTITNLNFNNPASFISTPTSNTNIHTYIFTIAGTYEYDCSVGNHAANGMIGTIIVNNTTSIKECIIEKHLVETYSILGNKTALKFKTIIINRYSDGTVDKRITIE